MRDSDAPGANFGQCGDRTVPGRASDTDRVRLGRPPRRRYPGQNRGLLALATPAFTNVTGIETLKIGGAADNAVTLGAKASADVGGVGHTFTLDDSAGLGGLMLDGSAMTADLKVLAGAGTDAIVGGAGNDTFFASLGNDIFTGGAGNNTFAFNSPNLGSDRITDFNNTTRADQIQVSAAGFGGGLTANQDVTSAFGTSANANFGTTSERGRATTMPISVPRRIGHAQCATAAPTV